MPEKKREVLYVANTSGFVHIGDEDVRLIKGQTLIRAGDPLLKAAPLLFDVAEDRVRPSVEQATAAPGETREA